MTLGGPSAPDQGPPDTPAIDRSVLGEWLAGDDAAINELLIVFRDSLRTEQLKIHEALTAADLTELAGAAHRLRGAALSMGAGEVADTAGALYAAARAADPAGCASVIPALDARIDRVVAEVPAPDEA